MTKEETLIKRTARFVGILFLIQIIAASISQSAILSPILYGDNFLTAVATKSNTVRIAMLLDLITGFAVFGIAVLLFPILKRFNESIGLWYVGLRLTELICAIISGVFLLTLIALSRKYVQPNTSELPYLLTLGTYLVKAIGITKVLMILVFCVNGFLFYYLLFRSRLVPRFISIWGIAGLILIFIEIISNIFGHSLGGIILMLPMGLNEIFLGIWLIVKGFNESE